LFRIVSSGPVLAIPELKAAVNSVQLATNHQP
jgi:hypothetical protein